MKLPIKQTDDGEAPLWHDADGTYISYEEITAILNRSPRDAARYRWLQSQACGNAHEKDGDIEKCYLELNPRDMDAAIDAALLRSLP
jgi:hypothetical protein